MSETIAIVAMARTKNSMFARDAEGKFLCPECKKGFTGPQGVGSHRKTVHGIVGTSESTRREKIKRKSVDKTGPKHNRKMFCSFLNCGNTRTFSNMGLKRHMNTVHGMKANRGESIEDLLARHKTGKKEEWSVEQVSPVQQIIAGGIHSCPNCGCNLEAYNALHAALQTGDVNMKALKYAIERVKSVTKSGVLAGV